ncbi:HAD family hydrolase [Candidatus Neomarinimicrobiota bacterium]
MKTEFDIIGFDADDTLWINQPNYDDAENEFCKLLSNYINPEELSKELYITEMQNLSLYGYGAKSFMLSMIETAIRITKKEVTQIIINDIITLGKKLINRPITLLNGVKEVLEFFNGTGIKIILVTKGDLIDQKRKLHNSKLEKFFHHIEIMSDKKESDYLKLLSHLNVESERFLMIGNSLKSDIIPVLNIGGFGIHIPYKTNWQHDYVDKIEKHSNLIEVENIAKIIKLFRGKNK